MEKELENQTSAVTEEKEEKKKGLLWIIFDSLMWCLLGIGLGTFLVTQVGFIGEIPSESMSPTLEVGSYIYVDRLAYKKEPVQLNDIVVFKSWKNPDNKYVKRVVGLPGDTIDIHYGNLVRNGRNESSNFMTYGVTNKIGKIEGEEASQEVVYPLTLGEGEYFVLGDNRENSLDSRVFGVLKEENIIGKYEFTLNDLK